MSELQTLSPSAPATDVPPRVVALMPVADARRVNLARMTVNQFWEQTYQNAHLLIVNSSGTRVTNREHSLISEIEVSPVDFPTISALRNKGIQECDGEWCVLWDDDDHSHPHRISLQMAHRRDDCCVLLSHEMRVDVSEAVRSGEKRPTICICSNEKGLANTVLFPRKLKVVGGTTVPLFDASMVTVGEDDKFIRQFGRQLIVLPNPSDWFPGPALHIAFWHGLNSKERSDFLGEFADENLRGMRLPGVTDDLIGYLKKALDLYGVEMRVEAPPTAAVE